MSEKIERLRLDQLLVEKKLANSRTHACRLIDEGRVYIDNGGFWVAAKKASQKIESNCLLSIKASEQPEYVSRAGVKLAGAIAKWGIDVAGNCALDVGQSTGGFTDCLLQHGAAQVIGLDVGHDQLAKKIQADAKVKSFEGVNARRLNKQFFIDNSVESEFDLVVMDVSFISQKLILPQLPPLLKPGGRLLSLVKPQFELGSENIGKNGIVRDARLYVELRVNMLNFVIQIGLQCVEYFESPIVGGDGNHEFFLCAVKN